MVLFSFFVELLIVFFSSWTLAYHLCLFFDWPAKSIFFVFPAFLMPFSYLFAGRWKTIVIGGLQSLTRKTSSLRDFLILLFISLTAGFFAMTTTLPCPDDMAYYHRALAQLGQLHLPFFKNNTIYDLTTLPPLSGLHLLTSYEPLVALTADFFRVNPLFAYQNLATFFVASLFPIVYYPLFKSFGLKKRYSLIAVSLAYIFLCFEVDFHRSFGNFLLSRCHQGKGILGLILLPLTLHWSLAFLRSPSKKRFLLILLAAISGTGLSGSSVVLIPVMILGATLSYLLSHRFIKKRFLRGIHLQGSLIYIVGIGVAIVLDQIHLPQNRVAWAMNYPFTWHESFQIPFNGWAAHVRNILFLFFLPSLCLKRPLAWHVQMISVALIIIFANPLTGPIWFHVVSPAAYWRLIYTFPLIFCAGLFAKVFTRAHYSNFNRRTLKILYPSILIFYVLSLPLKLTSDFMWPKDPFECKFYDTDIHFSKQTKSLLDNRVMIAPSNVLSAIGVQNPSIRWMFYRAKQTLHNFIDASLEKEGRKRVLARSLIVIGVYSEDTKKAVLDLIDQGLNGIIVWSYRADKIHKFLDENSTGWLKINLKERSPYTLFLRN